MTGGSQPGQDKGIVVLPQKVLEKIDRNKDKLSRAEFIEVCIGSLLEQGAPHQATGQQAEYGTAAERVEVEEAVSRRELDEFKKGIKNLQRAYIETLLAFAIEPAARASKEEQERLTQRVRELLESQ